MADMGGQAEKSFLNIALWLLNLCSKTIARNVVAHASEVAMPCAKYQMVRGGKFR